MLKNEFKMILYIAIVVLFVTACNSQNTITTIEDTSDSNEMQFNLAIVSQELTPNQVTVNQGDEVTLLVTTDDAGEFHIAGYEIEKEMELAGVTEIIFNANLPGRYNLELHPEGEEHESDEDHSEEEESEDHEDEEHSEEEDIVIGSLIVNPK